MYEIRHAFRGHDHSSAADSLTDRQRCRGSVWFLCSKASRIFQFASTPTGRKLFWKTKVEKLARMPVERPMALPAGTELGGFRIDSVLGQGGFGITYAAEDLTLRRSAVIKEFYAPSFVARDSATGRVLALSPDHRGDFEWGLDRFAEEARALGMFDHPNIVPIYTYFTANNTGYLVMPFVRGQTLADRLREQKVLPASELAKYLPGLLDGISAVHAKDLLHRDLKPDNIFIREDDIPVLIDFGAARGEFGTKTRSVVYSPGFAPYEQLASKGNQGPWTDIYSLGATLYRCVTGERPPNAENRVDSSFRGEPDPMGAPSNRDRGNYPDEFLRTVHRMLALREEHRPQSIADVRSGLTLDDVVEGAAPLEHLVSLGQSSSSSEVDETLAIHSDETRDVQLAGKSLTVKQSSSARLAWVFGLLFLCSAGVAGYWYYENQKMMPAFEATQARLATARQRAKERVAEAARLKKEAEERQKIAEMQRRTREASATYIKTETASAEAAIRAFELNDARAAIQRLEKVNAPKDSIQALKEKIRLVSKSYNIIRKFRMDGRYCGGSKGTVTVKGGVIIFGEDFRFVRNVDSDFSSIWVGVVLNKGENIKLYHQSKPKSIVIGGKIIDVYGKCR